MPIEIAGRRAGRGGAGRSGLAHPKLALFGNDPSQALQRSEAARRERTTDVLKRSGDMAVTFHNDVMADSERGAAYISQQWEPERIRNRYDGIYFFDAASVSI